MTTENKKMTAANITFMPTVFSNPDPQTSTENAVLTGMSAFPATEKKFRSSIKQKEIKEEI